LVSSTIARTSSISALGQPILVNIWTASAAPFFRCRGRWCRISRRIILDAPNRQKRSKTQDGRARRHYKRRWQAERVNAWLQNFRRVVVRYVVHAANFVAFVQLACIMILLRQS